MEVAASIAGLATFAEIVFRRSINYIKTVKTASIDLSRLATELRLLCGVLNDLELLITQLETKTDKNAIQSEHIKECQNVLKEVEKEFPHPVSTASNTASRLKHKLQAPFHASDIDALLQKLERLKTTFSLALGEKSVQAVIKVLDGQVLAVEQLNQINNELTSRRELETRVALDEKKLKVIKFFRPVDPRVNHDMSLKLRFQGTGRWFEDVQEYKDWNEGTTTGLWIYGIPGAGKTILTSTIIQLAIEACVDDDDAAVAYFYCDYKDVERQKLVNIMGALAVQLALRSQVAFAQLEEYYDQLHPNKHTELAMDADQLQKLLQKMTKEFSRVTIVVDGVDECLNDSMAVTKFLISLQESIRQNTHVAFVSRDEQCIRETAELADIASIAVAAHIDDLTLYVAAEMKQRMDSQQLKIRSKALEALVVDRLVNEAHGMFRWVVCQLDHLCVLPSDAKRRAALSELPPTLDATYERILYRLLKQPKSTRVLMKRVFSWVFHGDPIPVRALCEAVSLDDGLDYLDPEDVCALADIMTHCRSLFRLSADGCLESAHFTVVEFFEGHRLRENSELCFFAVSAQEARLAMAHTCLHYLTLDNFQMQVPNSKKKRNTLHLNHAFLHYAADTYPYLLREVTDSNVAEISGPLKKLFHPRRTSNFIIWADHYLTSYSYHEGRTRFDGVINHGLSPLHLAALLGPAYLIDWIITEGGDVNELSDYGTPLHWAILGQGDVATIGEVLSLILAGYPLEAVKRGDRTNYHHAKSLLAAGADLEIRSPSCGEPSGAELVLYSVMSDLFPYLVARPCKFPMPVFETFKLISWDVLNWEFFDDENEWLYAKELRSLSSDLFIPECKQALDIWLIAVKQIVLLNGTDKYLDPKCAPDDPENFPDLASIVDMALLHDQEDIMKELSEKKLAVVMKWRNAGLKSCLHLAVESCSLQCLKALLSTDAKGKLLTLKDGREYMAVQSMSWDDVSSASKLLAPGLSPLEVDNVGKTPSQLAVLFTNSKLLAELLYLCDLREFLLHETTKDT